MNQAIEFDHIFVGTNNFEDTIDFYEQVLGFQVVSRWGSEATGRGAIARSPSGFQLNLAEAHGDEWPEGSRPSSPTLHFKVADIDSAFAEIRLKAKIVISLQDAHWGVRWFVAEDPSGVVIAFFS